MGPIGRPRTASPGTRRVPRSLRIRADAADALRAPPSVSPIALPDQRHALQGQSVVDAIDGLAFGSDYLSKPASGNHMRRPLHLEREATDQGVDLTRGAPHHARLQRFLGGASQRPIGTAQLDARETRGAAIELLG